MKKTIVSTKVTKNGKPRAPYQSNSYNKPKFGCLHDWRLVDVSIIPRCEKCMGHATIGSFEHTQAYIEARMKSDRPSPPRIFRDGAHNGD